MTRGRQVLRDNAFVVAAICLPLVVILLFLAASFVPRWLVPPPAHDLLLRASGPYAGNAPRVSVDFAVHDGRIDATVRGVPQGTYLQTWKLFLFDHESQEVREVPVVVPREMPPDAPAQMVALPSLEGRRILAQAEAPDGYRYDAGTNRAPGIVGELFGMNRYQARITLTRSGRVIPVPLPPAYPSYSIEPLGWVADKSIQSHD